jgi:hypothetical protein
MKNLKEITARLEEFNITVYEYREGKKLCGYELNTYTDAGENKVLLIDFRNTEKNPSNANHFIELYNETVNSIDIDEEILCHVGDKSYMQTIGLTVGLQDLKDWKANLQTIFAKRDNKTAQQRQFEQVKGKLYSLLEQMQDEVKLMPIKGNSRRDCQRINILHHINELDSCINGIELDDFTTNEFSGDFKLSYS